MLLVVAAGITVEYYPIIPLKKSKGRFPLFDGNGERVITIYTGNKSSELYPQR